MSNAAEYFYTYRFELESDTIVFRTMLIIP